MNRIIVAIAVGVSAFLLAILAGARVGLGTISVLLGAGFGMFAGWVAWAWPRKSD
jgi:hypothetical protein